MSKSAVNSPEIWLGHFPKPKLEGNKYDRGHAIILGGPINSAGAAKLAARSALRIGAGLVSVACDEPSLPAYAASFQAIMTKLIASPDDFAALVGDKHVTGVLVGPGAGVNPYTKSCVLAALSEKKPTVLDADALTVFLEDRQTLFKAIASPCILTPHAGEFERLFDKISDHILSAQQAAQKSNAIVILKGSETVIAAPDGRTVINTKATAYLATAGTGDVLAGICLGLLTQGMEAFKAACAAVWLHAQAADEFGPGLIAEDIPDLIPRVLNALFPGSKAF